MKRRLRKKLHRKFLLDVCLTAITFDDELRNSLFHLEVGTVAVIRGCCRPWATKLMRQWRLCYSFAALRRIAPEAVSVAFWSDEFPSIRNDALIFTRGERGLPGVLPSDESSAK